MVAFAWLWRKGEESGHVQKLHELRLDCDADVVILMVESRSGGIATTGPESVFYPSSRTAPEDHRSRC